jgi:hypothetical protein
MKNTARVSLCTLALLSLPLLQACNGHYEYGHDHGGWRHGGGGGGGHHRMLADASLESVGIVSDDSASLLAHDYDISHDAAQAIVNFAGSDDQEKALADLGLSATDAAQLANLQMPSQEVIVKVASKLGEDPAKIEKVMAGFIADVKGDKTDISSSYWQACMSTGAWRTPENQNCQKAWWSGCSPAEGASACEAIR